jgi:uncharacterized protein (TIGR03067 family)
MRRIVAVLAIVALWPLAVAWSDNAKDNGKSMEGTWLPIEAELAGQKFPDEQLKVMSLTMTGGNYTVKVGPTLDKGTYKFDGKAKPMAIDITGVEGPNKGKTLLAICEQSGDMLRVCYDLSGKKRPTEFKTEKGTLMFLVTYKRAKP